ncbi:hypothetical protein Tco_0579070 [Tanacetum coccineum]
MESRCNPTGGTYIVLSSPVGYTPLTPFYVRSSLSIDTEKTSTIPHSRAASSARVAQASTQSVSVTCSFSRTLYCTMVQLPFKVLLPLKGLLKYKGLLTSKVRLNLMMLLLFLNLPMIILPQMRLRHLEEMREHLDIYALNREVRRLKKQTLSQARTNNQAQSQLKKLTKFDQPLVKHHALWLTRCSVTPDLERKSDGTEEVNIEEKEASNVKSGETEELDLETTQSTARQGTITPRTLNFEDEAGPSSPLRPLKLWTLKNN